VAERDIAERVDQRGHLGLRAEVGVLGTGVDRVVDVGLALAPAFEQSLAVQAPENRHVRRVRARLGRVAVEDVHDRSDRGLVEVPDGVHDLGLELVERWERGVVRHTTQSSRSLGDGQAPGLTEPTMVCRTTLCST